MIRSVVIINLVKYIGEIAAQHPNKKITLVHAGQTLLNNSAKPIIPKAINKVMSRFEGLGIKVHLNTKVTNLPEIQNGDSFIAQSATYTLTNGSSVDADLVIVCIGGTNRKGNLVDVVDEHNRVKVTPDLQVEGLPKIFCIGDANNINETKLAFFAGAQGALVANNIIKLESGKPTEAYVPMGGQKEFGLFFLPMGPKIGVGAMGPSVMGNYLVSLFKGKGLGTVKTFGNMNVPLPAI